MTDADSAQALWIRRFPALAQEGDPALEALAGRARLVEIPAGTRVFEPGARCEAYLLVAEGSVRVQLLTENGRELVLYHVGAGDSCVLTTSCLLGGDRYPAEGLTETGVRAFVVAADDFDAAMERSGTFRRFVFAKLGERLTSILARIEEIATGRIDSRLAATLLRLANEAGRVRATHRELAVELGTAREVISRHLKHFAEQGWISAGRGEVEIHDRAALERLCD